MSNANTYTKKTDFAWGRCFTQFKPTTVHVCEFLQDVQWPNTVNLQVQD